jgi:hypothetical protein
MGLQAFAGLLSIHSRVCASLQIDNKTNTSPTNPQITTEIAKTLFYNIPSLSLTAADQKTNKVLTKTDPNNSKSSFSTVFSLFLPFSHYLFVVLSIDTCFYLLREWLPRAFTPETSQSFSHFVCQAALGGVWILLSMEWMYCNLECAMWLCGTPLPIDLRHILLNKQY